MAQRILVLGASGYIGQHLVFALSQQGHQVRAAARRVERLEKQRLEIYSILCIVGLISAAPSDHCRTAARMPYPAWLIAPLKRQSFTLNQTHHQRQ